MPLQSKVNRVNLKLYTSIAILFIGLLLTNFTSILPVQAQETDIFRDNFEAYAVGTFPSTGGWEIIWDGMGKSYQVISTSYYYSPTKSLQLWGTTGWSAVVQRKFTVTQQNYLDGQITSANPTSVSTYPGQSVQVTFSVKNTGNIAADYHVYFAAGSLFGYVSGTITLNPNQEGKITLTGTVPSGAQPGSYAVDVYFEMAPKGQVWQKTQKWGSIQVNVLEPRPGYIKVIITNNDDDAVSVSVYVDKEWKLTAFNRPPGSTFTSDPIATQGNMEHTIAIKWKDPDTSQEYTKEVKVYVPSASTVTVTLAIDIHTSSPPGLETALQVNVHNIPGNNMPGAGVVNVVLYDSNYRKVDEKQKSFSGGESYVTVTFTGISAGSYIIEVYQTPNSELKLPEFWGADTGIKVETGKTTTFNFYRHTQVFWGVRFEGLIDQKLTLGQSVTPKVTVKNYEPYIDKKTKVRLIIDRDKSPPYDYDQTVNPIMIAKNGGTYEFTLPMFKPTESGAYYCYYVVFGEYGGTNNYIVTDQGYWWKVFDVVAQPPDLTITSVKVYQSEVQAGGNITVEFTEKNQGTGDSSLFNTGIYLGTTEYGTNYNLGVGERHSLKAGESRTFKYEVYIPKDAPPGEYYVTVFIDYTNEVKESNENNNVGSTIPNKITVKAKTTLILDKLPSTVEEGQTITFTGRLIIAGTNTGVAGATIKIFDSDIEWDDLIVQGVTDSNGYFRIPWTAKPMDPFDRTVEVYAKFEGTKFYEPSSTGQYTIEVIAPFDFTISASPNSRTITAGQSTTYTITVTLTSGSTKSVSLSISGLPSGATGNFNPNSGNPTFTSTLTITTNPNTPAGSYTLTITGTGGGKSKNTQVTLVVSPPLGNLAVQCLDVDGNPVPYVEVKLYKSEPWTFIKSQRADSNGRTTFTDLPPDLYYVTYVPPTPWKIKDVGIMEIGIGKQSVRVEAGKTVNWTVKEAGLVVYVKDQTEKPVQGANVLLYIMQEGKYQRFLADSKKITDSEGKVVYRYLMANSYYWNAYVVEVYKDGSVSSATKEIGAGWSSITIPVTTVIAGYKLTPIYIWVNHQGGKYKAILIINESKVNQPIPNPLEDPEAYYRWKFSSMNFLVLDSKGNVVSDKDAYSTIANSAYALLCFETAETLKDRAKLFRELIALSDVLDVLSFVNKVLSYSLGVTIKLYITGGTDAVNEAIKSATKTTVSNLADKLLIAVSKAGTRPIVTYAMRLDLEEAAKDLERAAQIIEPIEKKIDQLGDITGIEINSVEIQEYLSCLKAGSSRGVGAMHGLSKAYKNGVLGMLEEMAKSVAAGADPTPATLAFVIEDAMKRIPEFQEAIRVWSNIQTDYNLRESIFKDETSKLQNLFLQNIPQESVKPELKYQILIGSRSTDGVENVGVITFGDYDLTLPNKISTKTGSFLIVAKPPKGYEFLRWESGGAVKVADSKALRTTVTIEGDGWLVAMLRPINHPPYVPQYPSPPYDAMGYPTELTLSWASGDPDGDKVTYEVYLGTHVDSNNYPPFYGLTSEASLHVAGLEGGKTYYWRVVAKDDKGARTEGPLWRFTTATAPPKPDLIIEKIEMRVYGKPAGSNPQEGDSVEFIVTVKNIGGSIAPSGWYVDYYLDGELKKRDGPATISVGPGASVVSEFVWRAPEGSAGKHVLRVVVDPTNVVDEGSEANNERSMEFIVEPRIVPVTKGDLNNDTKIDAVDLVLMKKIILGVKPPIDFNHDGKIDDTDYNLMIKAADMNDDGKVDAVDLVLLINKALLKS